MHREMQAILGVRQCITATRRWSPGNCCQPAEFESWALKIVCTSYIHRSYQRQLGAEAVPIFIYCFDHGTYCRMLHGLRNPCPEVQYRPVYSTGERCIGETQWEGPRTEF